MNLFEVIKSLKPVISQPEIIPDFLYGAFRRKSISFYNGLTDENTIVYWFQSRSFTIDLRLKARRELLFRNAKAGLAIHFGIAPANSCPGK